MYTSTSRTARHTRTASCCVQPVLASATSRSPSTRSPRWPPSGGARKRLARPVSTSPERSCRVQITRVQKNTYFAELHLSRGEELVMIDARPSDSIAIALRLAAPIFAPESLLTAVAAVVLLVWGLFFFAFRKPHLVPSGLQNVMESVVDFVRGQVVLEVASLRLTTDDGTTNHHALTSSSCATRVLPVPGRPNRSAGPA